MPLAKCPSDVPERHGTPEHKFSRSRRASWESPDQVGDSRELAHLGVRSKLRIHSSRNRRLWYNWCCVTILLASYRANSGSEIRDSILPLIGEIAENAVPINAGYCRPIEIEVAHYRTF